VHSLAILSVGFLSWLPTQCAQNPFQFPEAWLLEHRIEVTRSGEEYDPAHSGELLSGGSPVFPSFDIPDQLPPISAFAQAICTFGDDEAMRQAGFCSATASKRDQSRNGSGGLHHRPDRAILGNRGSCRISASSASKSATPNCAFETPSLACDVLCVAT
jgi:hypothetical protein